MMIYIKKAYDKVSLEKLKEIDKRKTGNDRDLVVSYIKIYKQLKLDINGR